MRIYFCLDVENLSIDRIQEEVEVAICGELDAYGDLGYIDVDELGGGQYWAFEYDTNDPPLAMSVKVWAEKILSVMESNIRHLMDDEWDLVVVKRSVFE